MCSIDCPLVSFYSAPEPAAHGDGAVVRTRILSYRRAKEMAQLIKCLPCEHEDLSCDPQNSHKEKSGMVTSACNAPVLGSWR